MRRATARRKSRIEDGGRGPLGFRSRRAQASRTEVTRTGPDGETRVRLLHEARTLFAARGFGNVTVREICRAAAANVAAVNYHFGDKFGLYREVVDEAVRIMRDVTGSALSGEGGTSEDKLRAYIGIFMKQAGARRGDHFWIHQLWSHEMAEPTAALEYVVQEVIVPRITYMRTLIGDMLGLPPEDEQVLRCVLSVQSQFHAAMANPVSKRLVPGFASDPESLDRLAEHIADFSIGAIRSLKKR